MFALRVATNLSDIDVADANDLGATSNLGDLFGSSLGLCRVAADDAGVGTEMDERPGLSTADIASTASDKDNPVGFKRVSICPLSKGFVYGSHLPKMPSFQTGLRYFDLGIAIFVIQVF